MDAADFKKNYFETESSFEHSKTVMVLSLKLFNKMAEIFPELKVYEKDLKLLELGASLHDIGVRFEKKMKKGHHKIGRDLILENKISGLDDVSNLIVANIVRYHRRALPSLIHKHYKMLKEEDRKKTDIFSSIVRLADAFDYNHFNIVDDFNLTYDNRKRILTISLGVNIMLNIGYGENLNKKKRFFEKTFNLEVLFK